MYYFSPFPWIEGGDEGMLEGLGGVELERAEG